MVFCCIMNSATLYQKFSSSLGWNGLQFVVYKSLSTIVTCLLFSHLSTNDFSLWATTNSSIYLLILWLDLGLSKSIPRYAPVFARSLHDHKLFIKWVCLIQLLLLIPGIPLLFYYVQSNGATTTLLGIALATFLSEGLVKVLRLTYHAQFHNKQFNLMNTATIIIETAMNGICIFTVTNSYQLLITILAAKLFCSLLLAVWALYDLPSLYLDKEYKGIQELDVKKAIKDCASHSLIMGATTILTSLSERNFLIPLFTATLGKEAANIFKIANDWALLFYRLAIKTIGTTDTALLSHIETMPNRQELLPDAFKKLSTKIATLCIPLLGVLFLLLFSNLYKNYNPLVFELFFIIAISYMIEALFSMYERVLEVKRRYVLLAFCYVPYIAILVGIFLVSFFGLVNSVLYTQGVRLVQVLSCIYCVRTFYGLQFPVAFVVKLSCMLAPIFVAAHFLIPLVLGAVMQVMGYV